MAWTIGVRTYTGKGKLLDGIYLWKSSYKASITNPEHIQKSIGSLYYIENLEAAQKYVQYLSRHYRAEFRNLSKKLNIPMSEFRVYLLKYPQNLETTPDTQIKLSNKNGKFLGDLSEIKLRKITN